ncbi:MAG: L-methionine (R)-S-oxide reductase [Acetobacteraceae bacterium]|jgi:GAF domain-containing protein|nr:L-methionine (R)-S-oxide reductase [Acetobacteraceae bacterium]
MADKVGLYRDLADQIDGMLTGETDITANLANAAAALYHALPSLNWAGFYLLRGTVLVLGPFQGRPACARIPVGRGVCGTAAMLRQSVLVPDVQAFSGHIACDSASRSELVVPLILGKRLIGVWTWTVRFWRASMRRIRPVARSWRPSSSAT